MVPETTADGSGAAPLLREALDRLRAAAGEVAVNFSAVRVLDVPALALLERLSTEAGKRPAVSLCGVRPEVYKALKLAGLASRFVYLP